MRLKLSPLPRPIPPPPLPLPLGGVTVYLFVAILTASICVSASVIPLLSPGFLVAVLLLVVLFVVFGVRFNGWLSLF